MPMFSSRSRLLSMAAIVALVLSGCGGGDTSPPTEVIVPVDGPAWSGFGRDAQHTAVGAIATQPLARIAWSAPLDLAPVRTASGALLTHYGSPVITQRNTVLMPVKTGTDGPFRVEARIGQTGTLVWSLDSDYRMPVHRWIPSFNPVLSANRLVMPASGGRLIVRDDPESATGATRTIAFYGDMNYQANPAAYDNGVFIDTPITADSRGNLYFGFTVTATSPLGAFGGIVRIAADGTPTVAYSNVAAHGDNTMVKVAMNSAPALSADEGTLYVVVNGLNTTTVATSPGRLLALNSTTLGTVGNGLLIDPATTSTPARVTDDGTASPTVGPDGDVYIGVLEASQGAHNLRGWLLHFDAGITQAKTPGSFGWDITPSIVPRAMVPQYTGTSSYLLALKYNNYFGIGTGNGDNRVALIDPASTQADPVTPGVLVMREVASLPGPTPDPGGGVKEWCINTAAVDPLTSSILVNSEDGRLYRWHLPSNTFSESIVMNNGVAESYTPTVIAPDGRVYSVNDATLFSIGR